MKLDAKSILRPTAVLFIICVVVSAALAGTNLLTRDRIAQLEKVSGVSAPRRLAALKGKTPRFDGVTKREDMEKVVLNFLR